MRTLDVGLSDAFRIDAKPRWVHTGLRVSPGEVYRMSAAGRWVDKSKRYACGPSGYDSDTWVHRVTERCRSAPSERWFALIGSIDKDKQGQFAIGDGGTYELRGAGELTCYANDLWFMRRNNSGHVTLRVERVR